MKLSVWAKKQGITYRAAWNMFNKGLIERSYKLPTGTIIVPEPEECVEQKVAIYARVSSSENKDNLDRQAERLVSYCNARGWRVDSVIKETGSGLNDKRRKLEKILRDKTITKIVVEHKDRFSRFGVNYIELLLSMQRRELVIINPVSNDRDDLMQDFVSIITSFTARLYGLRRNKRRTEKLINELEKP